MTMPAMPPPEMEAGASDGAELLPAPLTTPLPLVAKSNDWRTSVPSLQDEQTGDVASTICPL